MLVKCIQLNELYLTMWERMVMINGRSLCDCCVVLYIKGAQNDGLWS